MPKIVPVQKQEEVLNGFNTAAHQNNQLIISHEPNKQAAYMDFDKGLIEIHNYWFEDGQLKRSSQRRKTVEVPGFKQLYKRVGNKNYCLYHRTHLIPFQLSLDEGDKVKNLLFTGSSYLNTGESVVQGIQSTSQLEKVKQKLLYNYIDNNVKKEIDVQQPIKGYLINLIPLDKKETFSFIKPELLNEICEKKICFSLKDIEIVVFNYILMNEKAVNTYRYMVYCHYNGKEQNRPSGVTIKLKDTTKNKVIFSFYLSNCL